MYCIMGRVSSKGSAVTKQNAAPAVFRLKEHMQRLLNSAKIYRMDTGLTRDQLCDAAVQLVARSGLDQCYIRLLY